MYDFLLTLNSKLTSIFNSSWDIKFYSELQTVMF